MIPARQTWPAEFADSYRKKDYWRGETFGNLLSERAAAHPDAVAVADAATTWTYRALDEAATRIAVGFLSLGLAVGDRVVVQLPNRIEFLAVVFGLFKAGILPVFALPAHRLTEISHFAKVSEAAAYIAADRHEGFDYRGLARELLARQTGIRRVIILGEPEEFVSYDELHVHDGKLPGGPAPSDVAFLQISGGSTGLSKLIPRTHDDYIYSLRGSVEICRLDRSGVYMAALPISHNFTMSSPGVLGALYAGGTVVACPSPLPDIAFPLIASRKVTITALVPPLCLVWLDAAASVKADLSSLDVLQVGGAKLTPEVARRVRPTLGATLQQVFGMAEGLVNYTRLDDPEEIIVGTQGRPISPDDELLIVDENGRPVAEGEPGLLLTRGPYTIRAYHNDAEANRRSFTEDGFYRTGDIVRRASGGNLVVEGRATDQINRGGEKISGEEVEDHLLAHPAVFDAVVVSVPDPYLGERSCAVVIARGAPPKAAELKAWIRSRGLAAFKVPDRFVFVDSFFSTAVGKVSRKDLRASLRQRFADEAHAAQAEGRS